MKFVVSFLAVLPALCSAFSVSPFSSVATSQRSSLLMAEEGMGEIIPHDFDPPMHRIEGGDTLLTWKMPPGIERVTYVIETNGRPLKGLVEMWNGPIRRTHRLEIKSMDGLKTPYRAVLKYKKIDSAGPQMLKIGNFGSYEFPLKCGVEIPTPERDQEMDKITTHLWKTGQKYFIQGGSIRSFPINPHVEAVQVIISSKDVCGKGSKAIIEVLQGPNNKKQEYDLQVSGGSQPYHGIFETPGTGVTLRIKSKNFLEFPFEVVIAPYRVSGNAPANLQACIPADSEKYGETHSSKTKPQPTTLKPNKIG